jgi:hypothetical protein
LFHTKNINSKLRLKKEGKSCEVLKDVTNWPLTPAEKSEASA